MPVLLHLSTSTPFCQAAPVWPSGTSSRPRPLASIPHAAFAKGLAKEIHYDNFKDEVERKQGESRGRLYGRVWEVMMELQGEE